MALRSFLRYLGRTLKVRGPKEVTPPVDERPQITEDWLFLSRTGRPLSERDVQRMVAEYARIAGVKTTPHTLRHTFATRALDKGVDVATLAAILGHSRLETTGRYLHPTVERIQDAVGGI